MSPHTPTPAPTRSGKNGGQRATGSGRVPGFEHGGAGPGASRRRRQASHGDTLGLDDAGFDAVVGCA